MTTLATTAPGELLSTFLGSLTPNTRRSYGCGLRDFARFVECPDITAMLREMMTHGQGWSNRAAWEWRASLIERGLSPSSVNRNLTAVRCVTKFAETLGLISWRLSVRGVKTRPYRDTRGPGKETAVAMIHAAEAAGAERDVAVLRLLYCLALRRAEVASLRCESWEPNLDGGRLAVLGKGRSEVERLTVHPATATAITRVVGTRETGWIFPGGSGDGPLSGESIRRLVRKWGERVGAEGVRPHGLRHTAITEASELGLLAAASFARHTDPKVTQRYIDNAADVAGATGAFIEVT